MALTKRHNSHRSLKCPGESVVISYRAHHSLGMHREDGCGCLLGVTVSSTTLCAISTSRQWGTHEPIFCAGRCYGME